MGKQNRDVVGLGNIVITAQTQRPQLVHGGIAAGDEDDWDACFAVDICAQGEAVPSGKPEIEKNEIRAAVRGLFRYINEVIYNQGLIAFIIQKDSQFLPDGRLILDNHYFLHRAPPLFLLPP